MLIAVGWWPPHVEFDVKDLNTVGKIMKDRNRRR